MHNGDTDIILLGIHIIPQHRNDGISQFLFGLVFTSAKIVDQFLINGSYAMLEKQAVFKFHAIRCKRNGMASGRQRKGLEIAIDQDEYGVRSRNQGVRILRAGI